MIWAKEVFSRARKINRIGLGEGDAEFAVGLVLAIGAAAIGGAGKAGKRGYWAIHGAQHGADVNQVGGFQELVAAIAAPAAGYIAGGLQHQQDLLKEFAGKFLLFAEFTDLQANAGLGAGEGYDSLESVAGAL